MNNSTYDQISNDIALYNADPQSKKYDGIFKKWINKAKDFFEDEDKLGKLIEDCEEKTKSIPKLGDKLSYIHTFVGMLRHYILKTYTKLPTGTVLSVIGCLAYFVSPIDLIPDILPGIGYVDDAFMVLACLKLIETDLKDYLAWRDKQNANR